jgi:hypothetical protein
MPGVDGTTAPPSPAGASTDSPAEHVELQRNSHAASGYHGVIITANGKYQGRINIGGGVYRYCEVADTAQQAAIKRALALRAGLHCIDEPKPRVQRGKGTPSCSHMYLLCTQCDRPSFRAGTIAKKRSTTSSPTSVLQLPDYGQLHSESLLTVIATPLKPGEARAGMAVAFASLRSASMPL